MHCPQCGELLDADEVESLCAACLLAGGLDSLSPTIAQTAPRIPSAAELSQDRYGPYEVVRLLGEGGMGSVFLARQQHPIQRDVALKVIKPGMDTGQVLSRFNYERQTLALMDHPNIARVYDAGATDTGRPYFVMEYIDGVPITEYCDQHRLNTRQRLTLFQPVCHALQHAHQKGILHRDIKPSNVLVTEIDGRPVPKVIDFGIAKATDQRGLEQTLLTQFGQMVGTPEYMSPEQADLVSGDVDTSSDVYSLGVLLYELLVGAVPFDSAFLRKAGMAELMRIIREEEAPPLPSKLTLLGKTVTDVAQRRGTDPITLKRQVTGDLNCIVLKAVEKNRSRRYAAVADLAADLDRHLEDRPVLASPPSVSYRVLKFVRRNRVAVLAGAAVFTALLAGGVSTVWQAQRAQRERAVAVRARQRAEEALALAEVRTREAWTERARAQKHAERALQQEMLALASLADTRKLANTMLFELDDKVRNLSGATPARETLVRLGLQVLDKNRESGADPQLGAAYFRMGELQGLEGLRDLEGAKASYRRSIALLEAKAKHDPKDPETRRLLALALGNLGKLEENEAEGNALLRRADGMLTRLLQEQPGNVPAMHALAEILYREQATDIEEGERALRLTERILTTGKKSAYDQWAYGRAAAVYGGLLVRDEDPTVGGEWLRKALDAFERAAQAEPANGNYRHWQALVHRNLPQHDFTANRVDDAVEHARRGWEISRELADADPANANRQYNLAANEWIRGWVHAQKGDARERDRWFIQSLQRLQSLIERYPHVLGFQVQTAVTLGDLGSNSTYYSGHANRNLRYQQASEALLRTIAAKRPASQDLQRRWIGQLERLGDGFGAVARRDRALAAYQLGVDRALELERRPAASSQDQRALAQAQLALSRGYDALGRRPEAITAIEQAIAVYRSIASPNQAVRRQLARAYSNLSVIHSARLEYRAAAAASEQAVSVLEQDYRENPNRRTTNLAIWNALFYLRYQAARAGDHAKGIGAARRSLAITQKLFAQQPDDKRLLNAVISSWINLGGNYQWAGQRRESVNASRQSLAMLDQTPFSEIQGAQLKRYWVESYLHPIGTLTRSDEAEEALRYCRVILPVLEDLVRSDPNNEAYRDKLREAYSAGAVAALNSGDRSAAIEYKTKVLQLLLEKGKDTASHWLEAGLHQYVVGNLELRFGREQVARDWWLRSLDSVKRARQAATAASDQNTRNFTALRDLETTHYRAAAIYESTGQFDDAIREHDAALVLAIRLAALDPRNGIYTRDLADARGSALRARWLRDGDRADFRSVAGAENLSDSELRAQIAHGWYRAARDTGMYVPPMRYRFPIVEKALEMQRAIIALDPNNRNHRAALAETLSTYSFLWRQRFVDDSSTRASDLERSEAAAREAREILTALKTQVNLTDAEDQNLATALLNEDAARSRRERLLANK